MKTTLNIPQDLLEEAMRLLKSHTKSETVRVALEELVRQKRVEHIIGTAGTLKFSQDWEKARHER